MISHPTTFVIGAGAGVPFGFPTAEQLYWLGLDKLMDPNVKAMISEITGKSVANINEFRLALHEAHCYSIDRFVEGCPEFLELGKALLAVCLLPRENSNRLIQKPDPDQENTHWLQLIWDKMQTSHAREFRHNKVSFITFNYDRMVEHYLLHRLKGLTRASISDCAEALSTIPFIHIYGSLGPLPHLATVQLKNATGTVEYGEGASVQSLRIATASIRLAAEKEAASSPTFDDARRLIDQARQIIFLGFSYGKENTERLGDQTFWYHTTTPVFGTAFGMEQGEYRAARNRLGGKLNNLVDPELPRLSCLKFMRRHIDTW